MTSGAIGVAIASGNGIFGRPQIIIAGAKLQADNRVAFARPRRVIARRGRANAIKPSLPGLTRQSILFKRNVLRRWMDARIKSGHDECAHIAASVFKQQHICGYDFAISPRKRARFALQCRPSKTIEGAGDAGCAMHRRPPVQKESTGVSNHRYTASPASPAQWFYGLYVLSSVTMAWLPPSPAKLLPPT
jgi:hypothetical protein